MGKAAKFKKFRKLANQMPAINHYANVPGDVVTGSELKARGIEEVGGQPVNEKGRYKQMKRVEKSLDHHKKMKQAYMKNGMAGVGSYASAVLQFVQQQKQKTENEHNVPE